MLPKKRPSQKPETASFYSERGWRTFSFKRVSKGNVIKLSKI
jgi:hypothetical protein